MTTVTTELLILATVTN